jgi:hypothetical protein
MANLFLNNPIRLDSPMATSFKSQILATNGSFYDLRVEKILWETPVTVGDKVVIQDNYGNILATLACDTANVSQCLDWTAKPKRWSDFSVASISSGVVWIYLA